MSEIYSDMSTKRIPREFTLERFAFQRPGYVQVAFLVAKFLAEREVDRIFGICGGHILPIWDCAHQLGIKIVDVRDERAAVHMAHAYSELTGKIGVALVTAGPGMSNAVTGIANAHISRVPLLVISGIPPRPQRYMNSLQDIPQVEIVRPICRYARTVSYRDHVLRELDEAVAQAKGQGNEPGPSFIDFPTDLLREVTLEHLIDTDRLLPRMSSPTCPDMEIIDAVIEVLWSAKKPLIITGRGARGSGVQLTRLLDVLGGLYVDTTESRGLIAVDHPACVSAARGRAMAETDVIFTIGRSLDFQLAYGSRAVFKNARFVRLGTSPAEVRSNRRGELEILGNVPKTIELIVQRAGDKTPAVNKTWVEEIRAFHQQRINNLEKELKSAGPGSDGGMHPYRMLGGIQEVLNRDAIIVADGGDILSFARICLTGAVYMDPGGFGCLGVGVPFGVCAGMVYPDRQVIVVTGDGSFGFNAVELDTAKRHKARVVFVVANNSGWNIERNDQLHTYGGRIVGTELPGCDYAAMASSFGLHAKRIDAPESLPTALREAFENAPALLDVSVTRDAVSADAKSGLPVVPDYQALGSWDKMERELMHRRG
jgi:acetolactate synthase-1/2/3 large subunit